ncbi:DUF3040 domain-containing protein [Streptomyces sp. NPDC090025]|uniref:DUF3040 domain-containing protein n=1 Tax=Streptomyces sp. NPDC090025 TaxID=3365922 RepID=UPI0038386F0D
MDGAQLSPRERRILAEIEQDLGADTGFVRALGSGRTRLRPGTGRLLGPATMVLAPVTLILFVMAVAGQHPALVWSFAVAWVLTLVCALRLLLRWSHRHLTGDERPRPDEDERAHP